GFEVTGAFGTGVSVDEVSNIEIRNCTIANNDGLAINNIAGLHFTNVVNLDVHDCILHDNYDRTNTQSENNRNIVLFGGGGIVHIHNKQIYQTLPITAGVTSAGITYKHSATVPGSIFEVDHNVIRNAGWTAIGTGSFGGRIHDNLIIDSAPITLKDFGG